MCTDTKRPRSFMIKSIAKIAIQERYLPLLIFTLSLLVSVCFNTFVIGIHHGQESDGLMYSRQAENITEYIFKTHEARNPFFPIFLSILYLIFDEWLFGVRLIISLLGAVNCLLIYYIAKYVYGKQVAIMSGFIAAVYPNLFYWSAFLLSETLFITLFLSIIYLLIKYKDNVHNGKLVLIGVLLGLAVLTRSILLVFSPLLLLWIIFSFWGNKKIMLKTILIIFPVALIVISPWTIRNYILFNALIPVEAHGGSALYGGNNLLSLKKDIRGLGHWDGQAAGKLLPEIKDMGVVEKDRYLYRQAIQWTMYTLREKPLDFLKLEFWKMQKAWFPRILNRSSNAKRVFFFSYSLIGVLGIIGLFLSFKKRRQFSLFYLIMGFYLLTTLIFYGGTRFRAPYDPILIIASVVTIVRVYDRLIATWHRIVS